MTQIPENGFYESYIIFSKKSWDEKILLNINKNIRILSRTFQYKNLCPFLKSRFFEEKN